MNQALAMPVESLMAINVGEMLAVPTVRSQRRTNRFTAEQVIQNVVSVIDDLILAMIERRTAAEFLATRVEVFPHYFQAVRALGDLARIVVPRHVLEIATAESFSETEAEFREHALAAFGAEVRDQALFTVWTLRRISDLCQKIDAERLAPELVRSDRTLFEGFVSHAIGARFSLDCLLKSMLMQKPMPPEVLEVVMNGLRGAVNAFAWARRAFDLRVPRPATNDHVEWDEEDQQLLNEATYDEVPVAL